MTVTIGRWELLRGGRVAARGAGAAAGDAGDGLSQCRFA